MRTSGKLSRRGFLLSSICAAALPLVPARAETVAVSISNVATGFNPDVFSDSDFVMVGPSNNVYLEAAHRAADGSTYLTGRYNISGNNQPVIAKLNADDTLAWINGYESTENIYGNGERIIDAPNGDIIQVNTYGGAVICLTCTTPGGDVKWHKRYDMTYAYGVKIIDGFVVCYGAKGHSGNGHGMVMAIDPADGSAAWTREYWDGDARIMDVIKTSDGGWFFLGDADASTKGDALIYAKLDASLNIEWSRSHYRGSKYGGETAAGVAEDASGDFLILSSYNYGYSGSYSATSYLHRVGSDGTHLARTSITSPFASGYFRIWDATADAGKFYFTGYDYDGTSYVVFAGAIVFDGTVEWCKHIKGADFPDPSTVYGYTIQKTGSTLNVGVRGAENASARSRMSVWRVGVNGEVGAATFTSDMPLTTQTASALNPDAGPSTLGANPVTVYDRTATKVPLSGQVEFFTG